MFTRDFLVEVRLRAVRKRVWFTALDRLERGILTLAGRVVDEVRSMLLNVELVKILAKLRDAMDGRLARHVKAYGYRRARVLSDQARMFGDILASGWGYDVGFARFLAFLDLNQPLGWRSGVT